MKQRQDKIKEKRKQTSFRQFLQEIVSWQPLVFHRTDGVISRFPKTERIKDVVKYKDFDKVNETIFAQGQDYDFTKTFWENFQSLFKKVSMPSMIHFFQNDNCDYADVVSKGKNIYLSAYVANEDEDVYYSFGVKDACANIFNSAFISDHSENINMSCGVTHSYKVFYSKFIINCSDIRFSTNLVGCTHCIKCNDLQNISYAIENKVMTKEEYEQQKEVILTQQQEYLTRYKELNWKAENIASTKVSGNFLIESEDVENGYFAYRLKNGRNVFNVWGFESNENLYDCCSGGGPTSADMYGVNGFALWSENCYICCHVPNCNNLYYSYYMESCSYCLGCVGLKNRQFCIFNKEYSKEERLILAEKIFTQMDASWIVGNFFPGYLNPFYFNDSLAYTAGEFTQEEITQAGYMRREENIKVDIPSNAIVIVTENLSIADYNPEILNKVIKDPQGNIYRIITQELNFYKNNKLPIPNLHWLDRMKLHFKKI